MSTTAATQNTLFGTIWIANAAGVTPLKINFNTPHTCVVQFGSIPGSVNCNWAESLPAGSHFFGLTGGSVSLVGSCSVANGNGQAQGFAAGTAIENWTFKKVQ
ncbi:MAG: hypothetical protein KGJ37_01350 [Verrucomicrobiota bacterium]|nr:hypothetical protein [Verrucomicrobiota bacterium]